MHIICSFCSLLLQPVMSYPVQQQLEFGSFQRLGLTVRPIKTQHEGFYCSDSVTALEPRFVKLFNISLTETIT